MQNHPSAKRDRTEEDEDATSIFRGEEGDDATSIFRGDEGDDAEPATVIVPEDMLTSILAETDRRLAEEANDKTLVRDERTWISSESDLRVTQPPPWGAKPPDELTSVLTEGDIELTVGPAEGTSILADDDLEFAEQTRAPSASYSSFDPRSLLLGRTFGGFRIVREMASGGMASVFLARKDGPGRVSQHAAIKVVHPHLACQSGFVDMFLDEARIVSCVHHPNVCRVLDFGTAEGTYYLAMEYVFGETWAALQGALAADDAGRQALPAISAYVIAQAAEGLHAAHEAADDQGESLHIVHRDVSPQNIFVAYDGTVRVLDFGIARAADRITTTQAGTVKGRLAYMAPEQMEGKPLDRRADIWSLGVVLREALENRRLFRKISDAETMMAVTTDPMPAWVGSCAPRLREIVDKTLEREIGQRYLTAHHLNVDLMRFGRAQASPVAMPEVSAWMHRLFKERLEEKRAMLQEQAPEPRTGNTGPVALPWRAAPSSQGFTPSGGTGEPQSQPYSASSSTQAGPLDEAEPADERKRNNLAAGALLFALVAGGAGAGVWYARRSSEGGFSEARLAVTPSAQAANPSANTGVTAPSEAHPLPSAPVVTALPPREEVREAPSEVPIVAPTASAQAAEEPSDALAEEAKPRQRRREKTGEGKEGVTTAPVPAATPTPPRVEASAPVAPGATGTVVVAYVGGWAEVYLGNKLLGTTPGRFTVPAGKQVLTIKPFGAGDPDQRTVEVPAGGTFKLAISPH
ncbi:MAG: protein kinase [Myxococcales bacterium]